MSTDETDNIEKISRMLELGGTMLSEHCDTCGSPLFRYQGEIVCPVCKSNMQSSGAVSGGEVQEAEVQDFFDFIAQTIMHKMRVILTAMKAESDIARIKEQVDCIHRCIVVLREIREINRLR